MRLRLAALALAALAAACGDGNDPLDPAFQPQVVNQPDNFAFQVTSVVDASGRFSYAWQNGGTAANVDRSSAITAGSVTVTVKDASGATVHTDPLTGSGSVQTTAGAAGTWTIEVEFVRASGTVNFRVQRRT